MSNENIVRRSLADRKAGQTDWARFDALTDDDIAAAVAADPDAAPLADDAWFANARVVEPISKTPISIRLDSDVLEWFRNNNERYQSKINAVLRAYMEHEQARGKR